MYLSFHLSTQTVIDCLCKDWDAPIYVFFNSLPLSMFTNGKHTSSNAAPVNATIELGLFISILIKVMQSRPAIFAAMLRLAGAMRWWQLLIPLGMSMLLGMLWLIIRKLMGQLKPFFSALGRAGHLQPLPVHKDRSLVHFHSVK
jgi:hypothetical protein